MRILKNTASRSISEYGFAMKGVVAALALIAAGSAPALGQAPAGVAGQLNAAEIRSIPVRAASLQPTVGEQVVGENGVVDEAFFTETRICTVRGCRVFIFDKRSGALILNDGRWSEAYVKTGRGREVIRVKAFTDEERPKPAPSDEALEQAPRIKKVRRPDVGGGKDGGKP